MKTFGFTTTPRSEWGAQTGQVRVSVAATSRNKAVAAFREAGLNVSHHFASQHIAESGNADEREVTQGKPGVVFWANEGGPSEYRQATTR